MEKYLTEQYDVFEDEKWLTTEDEIQDYFSDNGRDFLDCGQGYYEDEASVLCKIGSRFYDVTITAEIMSAKQDVGDRLYWVEDIENVTFREIDKPKRKGEATYMYGTVVTDVQKRKLESFMDDNHIHYTVNLVSREAL